MKSSVFSLLVLLLFGFIFTANAQKKSPPAKIETTVGDTKLTLNYNRPSVRGREVWGALVPYNKVWRTGANEANVLTVENGSVLIEGKLLEEGKYSLFTIPTEDAWTVIINKVHKQWGAYDYNADEDKFRVEVKTSSIKDMVEQMTFDFEKKGKNNSLVFNWEKLSFAIKLEENK